jgi:uncharacterized membrane-anchored protein
MVNTEILTLSQGIKILVNIFVFLVLYYFYKLLYHGSQKSFYGDLVVTTSILAIWLFSITIMNNITLSLSVPSTNQVKLHFGEINHHLNDDDGDGDDVHDR